MNAIDEYVKYFETKSKENRLYARISGHVILGQLTKYIKIPAENYYDDNRIHLLLIQRSGSGKSAGSDAFLSVSRGLGQSVHSMDDFSDASVAGTVVENDDNDETEERAGFLGANNFIHADEASTLFDPTKHQAKTLIFIQKACNPIGSESNVINRSLSGGSVETRSETSFHLTTFPPERKREVEAILNSGLLQRMLFYPRPLDTKTKRKMTRELVKMQFTRGSDELVREGELDPNNDDVVTLETVIHNFERVQAFVAENNIEEMYIPQRYETWLMGKSDLMYDFIASNTQREDIVEKMEDFINRWIVMIRKIATHHCIMNMRTAIVREDLEYAWNIIKQLMVAAHQYVEKVMTMDNDYQNTAKASAHDVFYEAYNQLWNKERKEYEGIPTGYISKKDLKDRACLLSGYGTGWFNKHRANLEDKNFVKSADVRTRSAYYMVLPPRGSSPEMDEYANEPIAKSSSGKKGKSNKNPIEARRKSRGRS